MPVPSDPIGDQLKSLRDRIDLIWANHEREHESHEKAHAREHEFAQKAIDTAALLAKENKQDANEWRETMNDRERSFATKADASAILGRLDNIERSGLVAMERERQRVADESEDKRQSERRIARSQWTIGVVVGLLATFGAILINFALRS